MAKRCARGLVVRNLLVTTEQVSQILNLHATETKLSVISKQLRLPPQTVEEIIDHATKESDRESWIARQVDRALRITLSDVERGKTDPHAVMVGYRGPTGKLDIDQYRHHRDDLEMQAGRELLTEQDRAEAKREIERLWAKDLVTA